MSSLAPPRPRPRPARPPVRFQVADLGLVPFGPAVALMEEAARARREGRGPDLLLLLEHPHVVTLGRNAERDHVLAAPAELTCLGVEVQDCDRGGDVTYHGPGQLVAWPVFQLPEGRHDVRAYVRDLEEAQIRALARFGIAAGREPGLPGVWVGRDKIGAVGVRISRWLTTHGLALNVAPDLAYFRLITPCGLRDRGVTSMERILGGAPAMDEVKAALARAFAAVFAGEEFPETR